MLTAVPVLHAYSVIGNTASASQQGNRREAKMEASGTNKTYDIRLENFDISYADK